MRTCECEGDGYTVLYLCQRILLLWREIYVSEEQGVVLEEDKIREYSLVKGGVPMSCQDGLPCRVVVEFQQSQKG
jgi:hypothetical protein